MKSQIQHLRLAPKGVFFGSAALAPWVAGAGIVYGVISVAGGEKWLNKNLNISEYINIVQPNKP